MTAVASDFDIVQRLREGDPDTLSDLVAAHAASLYRASLTMGTSAAAAEDLLQEVFATFLSDLDQSSGRWRVRSRLLGILYTKLFEARTDLGCVDEHDPIDDVIESWFTPDGGWIQPPGELEGVLTSQDAGVRIQGCVNSLPPLQRAAIELRELDELSSAEICTVLGINALNLRVLSLRASMRLRICLADGAAQQ